MLEAMAGFDPKDSTSLNLPVPNWEAALSGDIRGKRIGIPKEYRIDGVPEEIDRVWEQGIAWMRDAGAEIVEVSLPHTKYALPTYYIIAPAEASSNLARYDGVKYGLRAKAGGGQANGGITNMYEATRAAGFGAEVKRRIMIGTYVLSAGFYDAYFNQAQKVRALIAGSPARLDGTVKTSLRYIASGSADFSPSANAADGAVGVSSRSHSLHTRSKSRAISARTFCAWLK